MSPDPVRFSSARRLLRAAVFASLFALAALFSSCDRKSDATIDLSKFQPKISLAETVVPNCDHYPTLCGDPARRAVVRAYLSAWERDPEACLHSPPGEALLTLYADCYGDIDNTRSPASVGKSLKVLWDLAGITHITSIPPGSIIAAVGGDPGSALNCTEPLPEDPVEVGMDTPVTIPIAALPDAVGKLLRAVKTGPGADTPTFAEFVATTARAVHFTLNLSHWSPACPLDVCGSSEPLTRTLILIPASYVDKVRKPDWSLAAVAVHESAHIDWFHKPEVSSDPRLLLPVPNERHAWLMTLRFLRPLLRLQPELVREHIRKNTQGIQQMLENAHAKTRAANRILGLPEGDETVYLKIPAGLTWEALCRAL